jgi:hypothetical protein
MPFISVHSIKSCQAGFFRVVLSAFVVSLLMLHPSVAQKASTDSAIAVVKMTQLEKVAWLAGASVAYAGFDYVGFNLVRKTSTPKLIYRMLQLGVQAGITWFLYEKCGLPTAIAFNLVWWTFGDDFIFYGFTEGLNVGGSWLGRGIYHENISSNQTTWAYWTPIGILRGMSQSRPIAGNTLVAQSLTGAALSLLITINF